MSAVALSPMRGWLHCGLAAAASSGWLALADGWWQPGAAAPLLRWPVMAFAVLGAWLLCALTLVLALLVLRRSALSAGAGLALGVFAGFAPWLHAWLPAEDGFLSVAVAHSAATAAALLTYWLARRGPSLRLCALLTAVPAATLALGVLLPHALPALRSGAAHHDEQNFTARGERPAAPSGAPDLVLISVDTLRADALFPDPARPGVPSAPAPFVESLRATRALWAPHALSSSDQTLPGHVGMLAGLDAFAHGVRDNTESPDPELRFLAQELRDAGYRTAATITNALIGRIHGMDRGYDDFSEEPIALATFGLIMTPWLDHHTWLGRCMPERWTAQLFARLFFRPQWAENARPLGARTLADAEAQLAVLQGAPEPFFHFVHFMDPHTDYAPPSEWRGRLSAGAGADLPPAMVPDEGAVLNGDHVGAIEEGLRGADAATARRAAEYCRLVYLEEVMYVDDCLRRYVAAVEASGRPTVILLTADHGEMFGEHGLMEHANGLWEENLRVPFLLWGANVPPGELGWIPTLADVAPTLLTLAGLRVPPAMNGAPVLLPADGVLPNGARAPAALAPAPAPALPPTAAQTREVAVRAGALKWVGAWDEEGGDPAPLRAFDLAADPFERAPLASPPPALTAAAAAELPRDTWPTRVRVAVSDALAAMLHGLGYAGG
jgi:arylsulfatase A-like enzyme